MAYFSELNIGQAFTTTCGVPYIKKSSRTATVDKDHPAHDGTDGPQKWFYFGQREVVLIVKRKTLAPVELTTAQVQTDEEKQLNEFTAGYMQSLLWSSSDTDVNGESFDLDDFILSEDGKATCAQECREFFNLNYGNLTAYAQQRQIIPGNGTVWAHAGSDFALTRNGHGTGYWDRQELDAFVGHWLTVASESAGGMTAYLGDDGEVYVCKG